MDRQPGATITLSFALVGLFAIILYQPEHPSPALPHDGQDVVVRNAEPPTDPPAPMPSLTAAEPLAAAPAPAAAPHVVLPVAASSRPPSQPPVILPAQDGFTQAQEGETLSDVARRVYGSADEAEALWRLNRDLVRRRDEVLSAGTLLRTP
jgi:hypothetical protein